MEVHLREMSASEFAQRHAQLVRDLTESLSAGYGITLPEAEAEAGRSAADAFPHGVRTAGQLLRQAVSGDEVVGWLWMSLPGTTMPGTAWIGDVAVDEPYRSKGLGGAIMRAGEAELVERGIGTVGLQVYGANDHARRLYERLGYATLTRQVARSLSGVVRPADPDFRVRPDGDLLIGTLPGGRVRFGAHGPHRPGMGWIYELTADDPKREKALVAAVEVDLVRRGVRSLGRMLTGADETARRRYAGLGYELISQQMTKDLPAL